MEIPRRARVNSGPAETMRRRMIDKTRLLIATGEGTVITMASETSRKAQISPEMWPPVSARKGERVWFRSVC